MPNQGWLFFSPQVLQNPWLSLNTEEAVTSGCRLTLGNTFPSLRERSINKQKTQKEQIQKESVAETSPDDAKRGGQRNSFPTGTTTQMLYDCCNIPVLEPHLKPIFLTCNKDRNQKEDGKFPK